MIGFSTFEKMALLLSIICLLLVVGSFSLFPINLAGETYVKITVRLFGTGNWPIASLFSIPLLCFVVAAVSSINFKYPYATQFYAVLISLAIALTIFCFLFFYAKGIGRFNENTGHLFFALLFYGVITCALYFKRPSA